MYRRLLLNTGVQILGKVMAVAISLLTTGTMTRKLGIVGYGNYLLITSLMIFFDSLADFGTSIMGVREASRINSNNQKTRNKQIKVWSSVMALRLIMAGISLLVAVAVLWFWPDFKEIRREAFLAWVMVIFTSLAGSLGVVWQTKMKLEKKVLVEVLFPTIFLLSLWLYKGEISLLWVFGSYLVARLITLAYGWRLAAGALSFKKIDTKIIKKILRLSWPMGLYLLIFSSYDRAVDSIMIRRFLGEAQVAWYGLAYKIYGVLVQPAYFLVSAAFPIISAGRKSKEVFRITGIWLLMAAMAVMATTWLLAPWMVQVLTGRGYEVSAGVLRTLSLALIFAYMGHLVGFTLISKEGQKEMLGLSLIVLGFNLGANLIFIPKYGIMGAAEVTVATEALSLLFMSWKLREKSRI